MKIEKEDLVEDIKHLISINGENVDINPNYLEYFELDELIEIKKNLEYKKINQDAISNSFLDELFDKCS
ncbi:MAG: hypothetical protein U9O56_05510 [Campylobacterota bacterium]|nr:hypothetical protein [Campylobacterota bacterium]